MYETDGEGRVEFRVSDLGEEMVKRRDEIFVDMGVWQNGKCEVQSSRKRCPTK